MKKDWKIKLHIISQELLQYGLFLYILMLLTETFKQGFVSYFFNTTYLLGFVILSGIIMVITYEDYGIEPKEEKKGITSEDIQNGLVYATIGGALVYFKTQDLGNFALILGLITASIIFLLSILLVTDNEE